MPFGLKKQKKKALKQVRCFRDGSCFPNIKLPKINLPKISLKRKDNDGGGGTPGGGGGSTPSMPKLLKPNLPKTEFKPKPRERYMMIPEFEKDTTIVKKPGTSTPGASRPTTVVRKPMPSKGKAPVKSVPKKSTGKPAVKKPTSTPSSEDTIITRRLKGYTKVKL
jgi:hypothetical protein